MAEGTARAVLGQAGLRGRLRSVPIGTIEHELTHRRLRVEVYRASSAVGKESETRRPFTSDQLESVGISTLTRRLLGTTLQL
jgi:adenine-specific DNA glycosylase